MAVWKATLTQALPPEPQTFLKRLPAARRKWSGICKLRTLMRTGDSACRVYTPAFSGSRAEEPRARKHFKAFAGQVTDYSPANVAKIAVAFTVVLRMTLADANQRYQADFAMAGRIL